MIDIDQKNFSDDTLTQADTALWRAFPARSIKRVLFVAPPDTQKERFNFAVAKRGRYSNYPPYGVGVIATHLRRDAIEVKILNLNAEMLKVAREVARKEDFDFDVVVTEKLQQTIAEFQPDVIGVTCMFAMQQESAKRICAEIARIAPDVPIAAGGVHITNHLAQASTRDALIGNFLSVSFFFLYESEIAFRNFVGVVNGRLPTLKLSQVIFARIEPMLFFTNRKLPEEGEDLDAIPAHDLMTAREIGQNGKIGGFYAFKSPDTLFTTVLSNRGCRAKCTFCSVRSINGVGVRSRSVQSVIDELLMLRHEHGVGHIMWLDDDLLYDERRALTLFNEMVRQNVGITWDCSNGVIAASCTEEVISAAAAAGCIGLCLGVESGNRARLKKIRKPGTIETFLKAAEVVRKYEQIHSRTLLMIAFPGETYAETMDTIKIARDMNLDWNNVNILEPLPNTPIYDQMVADGLLAGTVQEALDDLILLNKARPHVRMDGQKSNSPNDMLARDFKNAFASDLTAQPAKHQWDDIWAYMNFHLNFERLKSERRPGKVLQQARYLRNIADVAAPESALAMYYYGYLVSQVMGTVDPIILARLRARLAASAYWQARFDDFNLSVDDLVTSGGGTAVTIPAAFDVLDRGWLPEEFYLEELASAQAIQQSAR
jgi:radical SAM superfamily enzyme YgiQ (UPF0313 family)